MKAPAYIITLVALAITACDNRIDPPSGELQPGQVDIHLAIAGNPGTSTRATIDPITGEGTFNAGDILGMYTKAGSSVIDNNLEYTVGTTALFWSDLSTTEQVTFSAHYPRITAAIDNPTAYKYSLIEQVTAGKDLLAATATAKKGNPVQLEFHHLMHRLIVNLKSGANMDGIDLSKAVIKTISAAGEATVATSTYVNLITGTVVPASEKGSAICSANGTKVDMIVVPQDLTPYEGFLKIVIGDDTWHYNVPASLNPSNLEHPTRLESGQCLTLTLTLKKSPPGKTEVELTSSDISAWNDQDAVNGDIEAELPPPPGTIDMTKMTADQVKTTIDKDLAAGVTEFKLIGPFEKSGIGVDATEYSPGKNPFANTKVTSIDLAGITNWPNVDADDDNTKNDGIGIPAYSFIGNNYGGSIYPSLTEVKLPADVKTIGKYAFSYNNSLTTVPMNVVEVIGNDAFNSCTAIKAVSLPEVINIMDESFFGCSALTTVDITTESPKSVTIGYGAFSECARLETMNAPAVTSIGKYVFKNCIALTTVTLTAAKAIGVLAFSGCTALQKLDLPAATEFDQHLINGCTSLTDLRLTAAGNFVKVGGTDPLQSTDEVFEYFNARSCALTLNADKKNNTGSSNPKVASDGTWCWGNNNEVGKEKQPLSWKSISYSNE